MKRITTFLLTTLLVLTLASPSYPWFYSGGNGGVFGGLSASTFTLYDPDVAHGITGITPTNNYGAFYPIDGAAKGGLDLYGLTDADQVGALRLTGVLGTATPGAGSPPTILRGGKKNAAGWQAMGNTESLFGFYNYNTIVGWVYGSGEWILSYLENTPIGNTTANTGRFTFLRAHPSTTTPTMIGNTIPVNTSTTATFPTADKTQIDKVAAFTNAAVGDLITITGGTGATAGMYRLTTKTSNDSVKVDRNIHAEVADIVDGVFSVYKDVVTVGVTDGTNGQMLTSWSHQNKPLQLGGSVVATAPTGSTGVDIVVNQGLYNSKLSVSSPVFTDANKQLVSTGTLAVGNGGTGATTLTDGGILIGATTGPIEATAVGVAGEVLIGGGAATNPKWLAPNTAASRKFLHQTGTGAAGNDPTWEAIISGDLTSALAAPPAIGGTTPAAISGTTGVFTGDLTGLVKVMVLTSAEGVHDGGNDEAILTDSGETFGTNTYVGMTLYNTTDGSSCVVTANNNTTMTCTLTGGTDNNWDTNDAWAVAPGPNQSGSVFYIGSATTILHPATAGYAACYYSTAANTIKVDPVSASMEIMLNGTGIGAGDEIDSAGAAGDYICIHNQSATVANTLGRSGTWTDGGAS